MLDSPLIAWLALRVPTALPGAALHRAALGALARGAFPTADALFERAADHYRLDLEVEALARLRVHQLIGRAWASGDPRRDPELCLDVEQRLTRLERIEALEAPHALVPASRLLASWTVNTPTTTESSDLRHAA